MCLLARSGDSCSCRPGSIVFRLLGTADSSGHCGRPCSGVCGPHRVQGCQVLRLGHCRCHWMTLKSWDQQRGDWEGDAQAHSGLGPEGKCPGGGSTGSVHMGRRMSGQLRWLPQWAGWWWWWLGTQRDLLVGGSEQAPPYRNACSITPAQQVWWEEAVNGFKAFNVGRQREGESREAEVLATWTLLDPYSKWKS